MHLHNNRVADCQALSESANFFSCWKAEFNSNCYNLSGMRYSSIITSGYLPFWNKNTTSGNFGIQMFSSQSWTIKWWDCVLKIGDIWLTGVFWRRNSRNKCPLSMCACGGKSLSCFILLYMSILSSDLYCGRSVSLHPLNYFGWTTPLSVSVCSDVLVHRSHTSSESPTNTKVCVCVCVCRADCCFSWTTFLGGRTFWLWKSKSHRSSACGSGDWLHAITKV